MVIHDHPECLGVNDFHYGISRFCILAMQDLMQSVENLMREVKEQECKLSVLIIA